MGFKCIQRILAVGVFVIGLGINSPAFAEEFRGPNVFDRPLPGQWSLTPAGQLQLWFDPLHNGRYELKETYTVVLTDRAPKLCGDPDGTGRHTWFFTDALLIEMVPMRSPATPMYPSSPEGEMVDR